MFLHLRRIYQNNELTLKFWYELNKYIFGIFKNFELILNTRLIKYHHAILLSH